MPRLKLAGSHLNKVQQASVHGSTGASYMYALMASPRHHAAASRIAASQRGSVTRHHVIPEARRERAAREAQRRRVENVTVTAIAELHRRAATIKLQAIRRRMLARKLLGRHFAARSVQRVERGHMARQKYGHEAHKAIEAARLRSAPRAVKLTMNVCLSGSIYLQIGAHADVRNRPRDLLRDVQLPDGTTHMGRLRATALLAALADGLSWTQVTGHELDGTTAQDSTNGSGSWLRQLMDGGSLAFGGSFGSLFKRAIPSNRTGGGCDALDVRVLLRGRMRCTSNGCTADMHAIFGNLHLTGLNISPGNEEARSNKHLALLSQLFDGSIDDGAPASYELRSLLWKSAQLMSSDAHHANVHEQVCSLLADYATRTAPLPEGQVPNQALFAEPSPRKSRLPLLSWLASLRTVECHGPVIDEMLSMRKTRHAYLLGPHGAGDLRMNGDYYVATPAKDATVRKRLLLRTWGTQLHSDFGSAWTESASEGGTLITEAMMAFYGVPVTNEPTAQTLFQRMLQPTGHRFRKVANSVISHGVEVVAILSPLGDKLRVIGAIRPRGEAVKHLVRPHEPWAMVDRAREDQALVLYASRHNKERHDWWLPGVLPRPRTLRLKTFVQPPLTDNILNAIEEQLRRSIPLAYVDLNLVGRCVELRFPIEFHGAKKEDRLAAPSGSVVHDKSTKRSRFARFVAETATRSAKEAILVSAGELTDVQLARHVCAEIALVSSTWSSAHQLANGAHPMFTLISPLDCLFACSDSPRERGASVRARL